MGVRYRPCKHGVIAIVNIERFWLFRQFIKIFQHNQQYELPIDVENGTIWTHVGYIASELCHVDVSVQCIKYRG